MAIAELLSEHLFETSGCQALPDGIPSCDDTVFFVLSLSYNLFTVHNPCTIILPLRFAFTLKQTAPWLHERS